jgi:hypothetical protein
MSKLVEDREFCDKLSKTGQKDIMDRFSPEVVGLQIKKRLAYIRNYNSRG